MSVLKRFDCKRKITRLRAPSGRRRSEPVGYSQAWPRIWAGDYREQLQLTVRVGLEIRPRSGDPDYKLSALTAWLQGCLGSKCSFRWLYLKIHRSQAFTFHWRRGGCCRCKGQNKGVSHRFIMHIHKQTKVAIVHPVFLKKISEVIVRSINFVWKSRNFNAKKHVFIFMFAPFTVKAWVVKCKTK